jgi:hypothetical protein
LDIGYISILIMRVLSHFFTIIICLILLLIEQTKCLSDEEIFTTIVMLIYKTILLIFNIVMQCCNKIANIWAYIRTTRICNIFTNWKSKRSKGCKRTKRTKRWKRTEGSKRTKETERNERTTTLEEKKRLSSSQITANETLEYWYAQIYFKILILFWNFWSIYLLYQNKGYFYNYI